MAFAVGADLKAAKKQFLEPAQLMSAADRAKWKGARQFGAFVRTVARRSMRSGGKRATFSQFDPELARLVFGEDAKQGRDEQGRFLSYADVEIRPWPLVRSKPGEPPRYVTKTLRKNIFFVKDESARSIVVGPTSTKGGGVPELLEYGGRSPEASRKWVEYWKGNRRIITLAINPGPDVVLKPRPFMGPAYDAAIDKLVPDIWRDSIS